MKTECNCTIYNKHIVAGKEKYQRTQIISAVGYSTHWENRKAANTLASGGNIAADQAYLYIPFIVVTNYLAPKAWQALLDKTVKWTLQIGDYIVKGLVSDEITDTSPVFTITMLKAKYDNVLQIKSVDSMDYGSPYMQHWKIGAG